MHPILFSIGSFEVRYWGVMVMLGVIAGTVLISKLAKRSGLLKEDLVLDFVIYAVIAGILGARIWEVLFSWQNFSANPVDALKFWNGGLSIQGGVLGGLLFAIWFIKKHHLDFWKFMDLLAPGLILGQGIGRIGCFFNGDAFGIPTKSVLGVVYQQGTPAYATYGATPLFPAELLEGAGDIVILLILLYLIRRKPFDGLIVLTYFILYSALRFTLEFWRGDSLHTLYNLKAAQLLSLATIVICIAIIFIRRSKVRIAK